MTKSSFSQENIDESGKTKIFCTTRRVEILSSSPDLAESSFNDAHNFPIFAEMNIS